MRKVKYILLPSLVLFSISWFAFTSDDKYFQIVKNLDIYTSLFKEVNHLYVDEIDPQTLVKTSIDGMLESLDPYTTYIPEESVEEFRSMTTGQYAGIGVLIEKYGDKIVVSMPYEGFAANKSGLKVGDELMEINGITINNQEISDISAMLKGEINTNVNIKIKRFGKDQPLSFTIARQNIKLSNVQYHGMLNNETGYIKLEDFTYGAGREVAEALNSLKKSNVKGIILDLRDNPGGLLNEAINVVNVFIPKGQKVVETKGRVDEWNKTYYTLNHPVDVHIPIVILVNENSASAAEIVSGAVQDYDRGILIGRNTFGKGLVQTSRSLSYNSQLKITTAKYYTPSGRCIQSVDYRNRDTNGNGVGIPDSLRHVFETSEGRLVYGGNGLQPDIHIKSRISTPIIQELLNKGLIFEYATEWYFKKPEKDFHKNESEFIAFSKWLSKKDIHYETPVEEMLHELKSSAKQESYLEDLNDKIDNFEKIVILNKKEDVSRNREIILELLEQEIATHQHLLKGKITSTFDDDPDIKKALELFQEGGQINKILTRN